MFLSNWFGGGSNYKKNKKGKKKKQKETQQAVKTFVNPVKNVLMFGKKKPNICRVKLLCSSTSLKNIILWLIIFFALKN